MIKSIKDIVACALLTLGQSFYFFIIVAYLLSFTGFYTLKSAFAFTWYFKSAYQYLPADIHLFRFWIVLCSIIFLYNFFNWRKNQFDKTVLFLLGMEIFWVAVLSSVAYRMLTGKVGEGWLMNALIGLSIPSKWFWYQFVNGRYWSWLDRLVRRSRVVPLPTNSSGGKYRFLSSPRARHYAGLLIHATAVISIILLIYVPHPDAMVARQLMISGSSQNTGFLMAPGFAYLHGLLPYVDVKSYFGIGIAVILPRLAQWLGEFDYFQMAHLALWLIIAYFILFYGLLKKLLRSSLLSFAAVLWMINFTVFGDEGGPVFFADAYSAMPIRVWWDVVVFLCLARHVQTRSRLYLCLAAVAAGTQLFYVTSSGICLVAALMVYAILWRDLKIFLTAAFASMAAFFVLTYCVVHSHMFTAAFWSNFFELMGWFGNGYGYSSFKNFVGYRPLLTALSFAIPALYWLSAAVGSTVSLVTHHVKKRWMFLAVLGVYGLLCNQHFWLINSPLVILRDAVIQITVVCLWLQWLLRHYWARQFAAGLLLIAAFVGILTNVHYIDWPNLLSRSPNPVVKPLINQRAFINTDERQYPDRGKLSFNSLGLKQEDFKTELDFSTDQEFLAYFNREFDFTKDAQLIQGLIPPQEGVALISSYELPILMQAQRKPFLYVFPLLSSKSMRSRTLASAIIVTERNLERIIRQFETEKPSYVFLQKVYLNPEVIHVLSKHQSGPFYSEYEDILQLLNYIVRHYAPFKEGEYLMALKRVP
jgi:hypothetical protein